MSESTDQRGCRTGCVVVFVLIGAVIAVVLWRASAADAKRRDTLTIRAADVSGAWPLTVGPPVQAYCPRGDIVLAIRSGGQIYPINGTARAYAKGRDWGVLESVWIDSGVAKISLTPMLAAVRDRCERISD